MSDSEQGNHEGENNLNWETELDCDPHTLFGPPGASAPRKRLLRAGDFSVQCGNHMRHQGMHPLGHACELSSSTFLLYFFKIFSLENKFRSRYILSVMLHTKIEKEKISGHHQGQVYYLSTLGFRTSPGACAEALCVSGKPHCG